MHQALRWGRRRRLTILGASAIAGSLAVAAIAVVSARRDPAPRPPEPESQRPRERHAEAREALEAIDAALEGGSADREVLLARLPGIRDPLEAAAGDAEAQALAGVAWELEGRARKAEAAYRRSLGLAPDRADARLGLARILLRRALVDAWPRHPMSDGVTRARSVAGVRAAREILPPGTGSAPALALSDALDGELRIRGSGEGSGRAALERPGNAGWTVEFEFLRGLCRSDDAALAAFERAIAARRRDALGWLGRGIRRYAESRIDLALSDLAEAIRLEPDLAESHHVRAQIRSAQGDAVRALADFDAAIACDPGDAVILNGRGYERSALEDFRGALADYDAAIRAAADFAQPWLNRGIAHERLEDPRAAEVDYGEAIERDPRLAWAWRNRGVLEMLSGRLEPALRDLDEAVRLDGDVADFHVMRADARRRAGDPTGATRDLDRAIELDRDAPVGWAERSMARAEAGDLPGAIADLGEAIRRDPHPMGYFNRARLLAQIGERDAALEDVRAALQRMAPADPYRTEAEALERELAGR